MHRGGILDEVEITIEVVGLVVVMRVLLMFHTYAMPIPMQMLATVNVEVEDLHQADVEAPSVAQHQIATGSQIGIG